MEALENVAVEWDVDVKKDAIKNVTAHAHVKMVLGFVGPTGEESVVIVVGLENIVVLDGTNKMF